MPTKTKVSVGDFAFCQKGEFGLILWCTKTVSKRTKTIRILYHGINLTPGPRWGLNWQSYLPKKATKRDLKKIMEGKLVYGKNLCQKSRQI